jgi:hypothetical protein
MSYYIQPQNQTLLWNTIQKNPIFDKIGPNRENWFKSVIQRFYQENGNRIYTQSDLQTINRATISYMIQLLNQQYPPPVNVPTNAYPLATMPVTNGSTERIQTYNDQFSQRQKEYDTMNAKTIPEKPAEIDEKIQDDAIVNMDELIKIHIEQREQELKMFSQMPPPPTTQLSSVANSLPAQYPSNTKKLTIKDTINFEIEELTESGQSAKKSQKTVSWKDTDQLHDGLIQTVESLKSLILNLTKDVEYIKHELQNARDAANIREPESDPLPDYKI